MSDALPLTPQRVDAVFSDCRFVPDKDRGHSVTVEGVRSSAQFHPERLKARREEILAMLDELPLEFRMSVGGGWSFLKGCMDRHGNLWTGVHAVVERLFQLGLATGKLERLFPDVPLSSLDGGMPYYGILDSARSLQKRSRPRRRS